MATIDLNDPAVEKLREAMRQGRLENVFDSIRSGFPDLPDVALGHIVSVAMNLVLRDAYMASGQLCSSQRIIDGIPEIHHQTIAKMGEVIEMVGLAIQETMLSGEALDREGDTNQLLRQRVDELNDLMREADALKLEALQGTKYASLLNE